METGLENYESPEQEAEEIDAPESPEPRDDDDDADADAFQQFLNDRRTIRYENTPANKRKLIDYLLKFSPPLPETPAALYLSFDELRKADKLELTPLGRERSADEKTEAEVRQAETQRAEPERTESESDVARDASALLKMFRKGSFARYKNGVKVG